MIGRYVIICNTNKDAAVPDPERLRSFLYYTSLRKSFYDCITIFVLEDLTGG